MRLRTFTGRSQAEAMRQVRESLGPDAVILSSQPAADGRGVRITAALEDSPLDEFDFGPGAVVSVERLTDALAYHRVPAALQDSLIAATAGLRAGDETLALAGALDALLSFGSLPEAPRSRPLLLIGPPGAGKTATAAKLCARVRLAGGSARLITLDTVKSGGLAQARAFADALGIPLTPAESPEALGGALGARSREPFVVIDTVGANPFDEADVAWLGRTAEISDAEPLLVLPAGTDALEAAETAEAFVGAGARGLIVTKLDAARRFGGILSAARAGGLSLLGAGTSPEIADGLVGCNPVALARLLLPAGAAQDGPAPGAEPVRETVSWTTR